MQYIFAVFLLGNTEQTHSSMLCISSTILLTKSRLPFDLLFELIKDELSAVINVHFSTAQHSENEGGKNQ